MRAELQILHGRLILADKAHVGKSEGLHRGIVATDGGEQGELERGRSVSHDSRPEQLVHEVRLLNLVVGSLSGRCLK